MFLIMSSLIHTSAVLIRDHKSNKVMFASSGDKKFFKKIRKLKWNVYEEINVSICLIIINNSYKYNLKAIKLMK